MAVDWDSKKKEVEDLIAKPGTLMSDIMALNPVKTKKTVNLRIETFKRVGELTCRKWVVKESTDPCILTQMHNGADNVMHEAQIKLTDEEVNEMAASMSKSVTNTINAEVTASISAEAGLPVGGKVSSSLSTTVGASQAINKVSTTSIARKIRSQLEVTEPLRIGHISSRCKTLSVPYGLAMITTIKGTVTLSRRWGQVISNPRTIEFSDTVTVDHIDVEIEVSVDPSLNNKEQILSESECATCDCTENWGPIDTEEKTYIEPQGEKAPTDPRFAKEKQQKQAK